MRALALSVSVLIVMGSAAHGADDPPAFEVASIKFHDLYNGDGRAPGVSISGNRVTVFNFPLTGIVMYAYGVEPYQVTGGPSWTGSQIEASFDITAKAEGEGRVPVAQFRKMFQTLLADRFQLRVHREMKDVPVYALVAAKNGPKLKTSAADGKFSAMQEPAMGGQGIRLTAVHETMTQFAGQIGLYAGRPILDMTGLAGSYDFTLEWDSSSQSGPSIFTAVEEQLGLKLEARKSPMEILVIDHAEKPSEN